MVKQLKVKQILFKKVIRSFNENWKNFISVILISFLALALYSGLTANYKNLKSKVDNLYSDGNIADIFLTLTKYESADYDFLKTLVSEENISKRAVLSTTHDNKNINILINEKNNEISKEIIIEGESGFCLDSNIVEYFELEIGDIIEFTFFNNYKDVAKQLNLQHGLKENGINILAEEEIVFKFKLTGIIRHPEAIENSKFGLGIGYCDFDYIFEKIFALCENNYNQETFLTIKNIFIKNQDFFVSQLLIKDNNYEEILKRIDKYFQSKEINNLLISMDRDALPSNIGIQNDIDQAKKLTFVFPTIFFLVSALVILTTLSQMIYKERTQIGTLKAIGIKKKQIFWHYISYAIFLTSIGSLLGLLTGPLFIPSVMDIKYKLLWSLPEGKIHIITFEAIICLIILVFLSAIVSFFIVRKEVNLKPVDSLRPVQIKEIKSNKNGFNENVSLPMKMAFRNIMISKTKSFMVIIGTLGCTALLVCGFGIMDTLNYGIDYDATEILPVDINVTYDTHVNINIKDEILKIENVEYIEEYLSMPVKVQNDLTMETKINLIDGNSTIFKIPLSNNKVVISNDIANTLKLKKGDTLVLIVYGKRYERKVENIFKSSTIKGIYAHKIDFEDLKDVKNTNAYIKTKTDNQNNDISDYIKTLEGINSSISSQQQRDYANDLLSTIKNMTYVVELFAILLAIVVIFNLANLNLKERTRDIATLKVLGFNKKEIGKTFSTEIFILTILGIFFGLFFGYPMCVLVLTINQTALINFLYHIYPLSYIYAVLLCLITTYIINIFILKKAKKIPMIESLKSVE